MEPIEEAFLKQTLQKKKRNPMVSLALLRALENGDTALREDLFCDVWFQGAVASPEAQTEARALFRKNLEEGAPSFYCEKGFTAFPLWAHMERSIADNVAKRLSFSSVPLDEKRVLHESLNEQQREAITKACGAKLFFMTGGPGTGKTYTAGLYLKAQFQQKANGSQMKILLLAPTGKAVHALKRSIHRALEDDVRVEAMTIHALLARWKGPSLFFDAIIVDEASMIDTELMYRFLQAVDETSPLLFIGDAEQLPPIEPGQPFSDIVLALEEARDPHVVRLTEVKRTESRELVLLAQAISKGERIDCAQFQNEVQFVPVDSKEAWQEAEQKWLHEVFSPWTERTISFDEAKKYTSRRVLLTFEKRGSLGSERIIARALGQLPLKRSPFMPLLATKNSYDLQIMNGDIGVLERKVRDLDMVHFAKKSLPFVLLEGSEPAYAMTVHKSQGSEFEEVHLVVSPSESISRKHLYTALTRARSKVVLYGTQKALEGAIARTFARTTLLPLFFEKLDLNCCLQNVNSSL